MIRKTIPDEYMARFLKRRAEYYAMADSYTYPNIPKSVHTDRDQMQADIDAIWAEGVKAGKQSLRLPAGSVEVLPRTSADYDRYRLPDGGVVLTKRKVVIEDANG